MYGEDNPLQWKYLAKWAGFENWSELVKHADESSEKIRLNITAPHSNRTERAYAAIERRRIWNNYKISSGALGVCPKCGYGNSSRSSQS